MLECLHSYRPIWLNYSQIYYRRKGSDSHYCVITSDSIYSRDSNAQSRKKTTKALHVRVLALAVASFSSSSFSAHKHLVFRFARQLTKFLLFLCRRLLFFSQYMPLNVCLRVIFFLRFQHYLSRVPRDKLLRIPARSGGCFYTSLKKLI